ncbi:tripartite tricarboxylate transporter TctA family protein [Antarctobacter heliothermus]|uniref:Tripartite tricarboxylate transporter TctA family protein n=1 Tax=Antarctobacter heliothermus TaxID=74033 RepID=A0A222E519_9RHOB|nr:tripartite tricarboxylate transporter permease [Antarctobacter heliothermus]ASP21319.1 tripartite tricarboxylate transporter TctA family protein [Antarctobacter heliothermus]
MDPLFQALYGLAEPVTFLTLLLSVVIGLIIGAIPGLSVNIAVALAVPLTIFMPTDQAMVMLIGLYGAGIFGGSVSAILLNAPGTPASAATIFDGFPMAQQGLATKALRLSLISSVFGAVFSIGLLILLAPQLASFALGFGPVEIASLLFFTFLVIGILSGNSLVKGLFSAALGMVLATVGSDPMLGIPRFTFGSTALMDGLTYVPLLVGLFAVAEIIEEATRRFSQSVRKVDLSGEDRAANRISFGEVFRNILPMTRASAIGSAIGILPGIGATIASFLAYADAKRAAGSKGNFGKGDPRGVVASESANNAVVGATFIPTLALGIPGDAVTAILLGALVLQGVSPGPLIFVNSPEIVYTIYFALLGSTLLMGLIGYPAMRMLSLTLRIPKIYLMPCVALVCVAGSYVARNNILDVYVMLGAGILGFIFNRTKVPVAPLLISFIITPSFEEALRQALTRSRGSFEPFMTNPVTLTLVAIVIGLVGLTLWRQKKLRSKKAQMERMGV